MRPSVVAIAIACLAGRAPSPAQAPPSPFAAISGIVLNDAAAAPVPHAQVFLTTLDEPPLEALTFTESDGAFGFTMIPPGKYRLRVEMPVVPAPPFCYSVRESKLPTKENARVSCGWSRSRRNCS